MNSNDGKHAASPVFVLCTPRSGSSLLRYILDAHPDICCPAELSLGEVCERLYGAVYFTTAQVSATGDEAQSEFASDEVRRIVNDLMGSYAKLKHKQIWCEKTPKNLQHLPALQKTFPDANFICLYRNCMDMVHSCIEASKYGKMDELWDYARIFESWIEQTQELLKFERNNKGKCIRVKYESLVTSPLESLNHLFTFLGVEWEESLLDQVFLAPHDAGPGDVKVVFSKDIYITSVGKGAAIKRDSISAGLLQKINALLGELDYPEVGPDWDRLPSPYLTAQARPHGKQRLAAVGEVFTTYMSRQAEKHKETLRGINGTLKFIVKGAGGGIWKIDLTSSPHRVTTEDGKTDCTITTTSSDLVQMVNGELNAGECFLQSRLQVVGNQELAYKFGQVLFNN
jgi:hypothetical protein